MIENTYYLNNYKTYVVHVNVDCAFDEKKNDGF